MPFRVTRNNIPIEHHSLRHRGKNANITTSSDYTEFDAAIAAGATLEELYKWQMGLYPTWFMAKVVIWHDMSRRIETHINDVNIPNKKGK